MVDRYTKVVLTVIAVGLWVQVAIALNPVKAASAELGFWDKQMLEGIQTGVMENNAQLHEIYMFLIKNL